MENLSELKNLYLESFTEDSEEDAEYLFKNVFSKAELISEKRDGKTVSMLFLMDCNLISSEKVTPYYYLYAACTRPEYRGRGIMGNLLRDAVAFAKKNGKEGIILKPAKPSLFGFYEKHGFKPFFKYSKATFSLNETKIEPISDFYRISAKKWQKQRKQLLKNFSDCFVSFPKDLCTAALCDCTVATDKKGAYIVYEIRNGVLLCKECLFENGADRGILPLVAAVLKENNLDKAELRFPLNDSSIISSISKEEFFSVISKQEAKAKRPYHGFAFD